MEKDVVKGIISRILNKITGFSFMTIHPKPMPIGISNRHVHLSSSDLKKLFGSNYKLTKAQDLSQTGQYSAEETLIIAGPKGSIQRVRILGPERSKTQVEILRSDMYKLGIITDIRESGDLKETESVTLIGPNGSIQVKEGLIVAKRHIHMKPKEAEIYGVCDGEIVQVIVNGKRGLVFDNVVVRVSNNYVLDFHIDIEEANAAGLNKGDNAYLLRLNNITESNYIYNNKVENSISIKVLTEQIVKDAYYKKEKISVQKDTIITPLAKDAIKKYKVELINK